MPRSIVQKDLVPKGREMAQRGQDMLSAYRMEAFTPLAIRSTPARSIGSATEVYTYSFRQLPWSENSLGFVKINFPNKDAVYMHDTPLKSLFGRNVRFESSGCVRVHNVEGLVTWILRDTPGWSLERVLAMKQSGEQARREAVEAAAGLLRLYQRLGHAGRRRELPSGHLQPRRLGRDRLELLGRRAAL